MGAQGVDAGTNGTVYFDDFESRRFSYIGTLTDPGVDDPQATNAAGWFARTYTYSTTIPHAVTNVTPETGSPDTYQYDANGNMTCRVESGITFKQDYNAENRISAIHKMNGNCSTGTVTESWLYGYDGDGVRVTTAHYAGVTLDSMTLYYMGGMYEVTGSAVKKYYSIAGQTVAMNDGSGLKYLLTDHLGSTSAVVDANGSLLSQQRYLPFGEVRSIPNSPIIQTDFGYTGQRNLSGTGLMDYRARFYSQSLGRFIQPDSIIPNPANPQSWNRYSYVRNNPILFNDPTGHWECDLDPDECEFLEKTKKKTQPPPPRGGTPTPPAPTNTPPPTNTPSPTPTPNTGPVVDNTAGGYEVVAYDPWENLANFMFPAYDSGSKLELYGSLSLIAGGQWGWTLITTRDGDLQLYYEHGITTGLGGSVNLVEGIVGGLEIAAEYEGGAVSFAVGGTAFGQAWVADNRGTGGLDLGGSLGVSIIPISVAHTVADPIDGWSTQLTGPGLFICRWAGQCGR
jgi:RHS repeat-associated protein